MSIYRDLDVAHLNPRTIQMGEDYTLGLLEDDHPNLSYLRKNTLCLFADNTYSVIKLAEEMVKTPQGEKWCGLKRHDVESEKKSRDNWTAFPTFSESVQALLYNPKHLYPVTYNNDLITEQTSSGNQITYDVTGDYLDVDRFLVSDPECFANTTGGKVQARFVDLIIVPDVFCGVGARDSLKISREVSRAVEWLEFNHIRCRVLGMYTCECSHIEVKLKNYNEKLNENEIKVFCSPDFFRRITFAFTEFSPTYRAGYGAPQPIQQMSLNHAYARHQGVLAYAEFFGIFGSMDDDYQKIIRQRVKQLAESVVNAPEEEISICLN